MNTLGMNEVPYDAIFENSIPIMAEEHVANMAKSGKKVLIICFDRSLACMFRDRFVTRGCSTNLVKDGLEIGQRDPDI
jgi:hypothetical protein